ncbi:MAG: caspase family protein [Cyanobacteria bacterium P01_F01_bin.150]
MKRRHLLQLAGTTLATLGINTLQVQRQGLQYARTLAQPTRRKRALLVGINDYPQESRFTDLKGCLKDVEMQEQLLRHRFGFTDIETLLNEEATRDNILHCFKEFLIEPCRDEDVIVFHFSGHGRQVLDPDGGVFSLTEGETEPLNSTIVPADDDSALSQDKVVSDIMGRTLFLLTSALKTPNVTIILDSCYSGGGVRGNTRVRSAADDFRRTFELRARPEVLDYQNGWISELGLTPKIVKERRDMGIAKGIAIASAHGNQKAVDASFDQFHAGAFTYFLTQYLWHEADSVQSVISNVSVNLNKKDFKQRPIGCIAPASCNEPPSRSQNQPIYFVDPQDTNEIPSEAVLLSQSGDRATIWLGGSSPSSIVTYGEGAEFMLAKSAGEDVPFIKVLSRNGLFAEVELSYPLPAGTPLQEASRIVPRDVTLNIGLDPSLLDRHIRIQFEFNRLDLGDRFNLVIPQAKEIDGDFEYSYGDRDIHYILSRFTCEYREFLLRPNGEKLPENEQPELPEDGSIVLLSAGIDSIAPGSVREGEGAIADIIASLKTTFRALYTARFLKLAINSDPDQVVTNDLSRFQVDIQLQFVRVTEQGFEPIEEHPTTQLRAGKILEIPLDTDFIFTVTNHESYDLHLSIIEVDGEGNVKHLLPSESTLSEEETRLRGNTKHIIPSLTGSTVSFYMTKRLRSEFLFFVSKTSPKQALLALRNSDQRAEKIPVAESLLADMGGILLERSNEAQRLAISTSEVAIFSIPFQVV